MRQAHPRIRPKTISLTCLGFALPLLCFSTRPTKWDQLPARATNSSAVRGMPRSARTSRQAAMASRILARASSRVSPWLTHPGMAGHSTTQTPSSSRSSVVTNFMTLLVALLSYFGKHPVTRPEPAGAMEKRSPQPRIRASTISVTCLGLALPLLCFITCPTRKLAALSLPSRTSPTGPGFAAMTS